MNMRPVIDVTVRGKRQAYKFASQGTGGTAMNLNDLYEQWRTAPEDGKQSLEGEIYKAACRRASPLVRRGFPRGNPDLMEDIATEVVCELDSFHGESKFTAWINGIARRKTAEALRKLVREKRVFDLQKAVVSDPKPKNENGQCCRGEIAPKSTPDFDARILCREVKELLSERDTILIDYKYNGLSDGEIAGKEHISKVAVQSREARLRRKVEKENILHPMRRQKPLSGN